jgi:hypothetical protein
MFGNKQWNMCTVCPLANPCWVMPDSCCGFDILFSLLSTLSFTFPFTSPSPFLFMLEHMDQVEVTLQSHVSTMTPHDPRYTYIVCKCTTILCITYAFSLLGIAKYSVFSTTELRPLSSSNLSSLSSSFSPFTSPSFFPSPFTSLSSR